MVFIKIEIWVKKVQQNELKLNAWLRVFYAHIINGLERRLSGTGLVIKGIDDLARSEEVAGEQLILGIICCCPSRGSRYYKSEADVIKTAWGVAKRQQRSMETDKEKIKVDPDIEKNITEINFSVIAD